MINIIRTVNIGTIEEPTYWGAVIRECETKEEAREFINNQPRWLRNELRLKEDNNEHI